MIEQYKNKYLWLYLTGFFLILVLPFLNLPPWFSPPDWGKTIVFRIILSILIFLFIWQLFSEKKLSIKTSLPFWLLIALLGVFLLATIFSLDRTFSFWGTPYRSGGFLNFAFYIIFAILAFLVLRKSDWQKIWIFSLIVAILVCLIAIFQEFRIFSKIFVPTGTQPWSTIGSSSSLAVYLLLLTFLTISFIIKSVKNLDRKWFFYFPALLLFIFVILISGGRAAYLGLIIGLVYFIFGSSKKIKKIKIITAIFLIFVFLIIFYLNTQLPLPEIFQKNKILRQLKPQFSISLFLNDPRFSVWEIASKGLITRPVLGYGLENFSIAFDKYYDPSLPRMGSDFSGAQKWYDRAHSSFFEIGITAGIPAVIIYFSLFAVLFWGLQKIKKKRPEHTLICHGVQATFLAYLFANLFSFDVFSTYLIFFLLIAFSLHLIGRDCEEKTINQSLAPKIKYPLIILLFIGLCWFVWAYNIKPFQINTEINKAVSSANKGQCERALRRMESILNSDTFLDNYLKANYLDVINIYILKEPKKSVRLVPRGIEILQITAKEKPTYTRYWLLLGSYYNIMLENYQNVYPEFVDTWKNEAIKAFEKTEELSPKRQEIFIGWAETYFLTEDFQTAKEKAQKCIELNPELGRCWWTMALINIGVNEIDKAKENLNIAKQKGYPIDSEISLLELRKPYLNIENYQEICEINYKLREINSYNAQYNLDSLVCYMKEGKFEEAKKLAEYIIEYWPRYREPVKELLSEIE